MSDFVSERELDYGEIYRRGGHTWGDEDFALFKCSFCDRIYLLEYEVGTVFLDGRDLSLRIPVSSEPFPCQGCGRTIPRDRPWVGPKAAAEFQVTWDLLAGSEWAWTVPRLRETN